MACPTLARQLRTGDRVRQRPGIRQMLGDQSAISQRAPDMCRDGAGTGKPRRRNSARRRHSANERVRLAEPQVAVA